MTETREQRRARSRDLGRQEGMVYLQRVVDQAELASRWVAQLQLLGTEGGPRNRLSYSTSAARKEMLERAEQTLVELQDNATRAFGAAASSRLMELRGLTDEVVRQERQVAAMCQRGGLWMGAEPIGWFDPVT